jgi:hypothetical protein
MILHSEMHAYIRETRAGFFAGVALPVIAHGFLVTHHHLPLRELPPGDTSCPIGAGLCSIVLTT